MKKFKACEILLIVKFHRLFNLEVGFVPASSLKAYKHVMLNNDIDYHWYLEKPLLYLIQCLGSRFDIEKSFLSPFMTLEKCQPSSRNVFLIFSAKNILLN
jgi:hypothetical protein